MRSVNWTLLMALALCTLACGETTECPDTYGACIANVESLNATYEACGNPTVLDTADCEPFNNPDVCIDCIADYECKAERVQCVDGRIETSDVECPGCE